MATIEFTLTDLDFQVEPLNFLDLSPAEFENLVFHLLDEMGFSKLVWRKGGEGNSATDGGRDLEATSWRVEPVGSVELAYWFEVKHRRGQLQKSQVQKAVLDASSEPSLDNLVIITNSTISNPCLGWIRDFQKKQRRPSVAVWQGHDLEVLLRKNPRTLARFLPTALSFSGRCKVIESRFWNLFLLPSVGELTDLWVQRETIGEKTSLLLASVLSEATHGNLVDRPWAMEMSEKSLIATTAVAVRNVYLLAHRISTLNRSQEPLIEGISYLVGALLVRIGHKLATELVYQPERFFKEDLQLPDKLKSDRIKPIFATLYDQLATFCSSANYCPKLSYRDPREGPRYFARYAELKLRKPDDKGFLVMNSKKDECQLGLVETGAYCPLSDDLPSGDLTQTDLGKRLAFAESVLRRRVAEEVLKK
jgi:hypothetical protein